MVTFLRECTHGYHRPSKGKAKGVGNLKAQGAIGEALSWPRRTPYSVVVSVSRDMNTDVNGDVGSKMGPLRFSSAKMNTTVRPTVFPLLLAVT